MARFRCQVCDTEFEVSRAARARYPGWEPKYCREHSPSKRTRRGGHGGEAKGAGEQILAFVR